MNDKPTNRFYLILILGLLTAIGPFSIDMYLPAFPDIAKGLHTTVSQVMLSLSSFFIGISAGQFIYGPLLERYGRKKPLYAGLTIYLLASLGCALAASVQALIALRLLQALGGCVGMVAARAMVRDLFEVKENAKVFSTLMLVVAVSPIVAPTAGGYVTAILGWRWVFALLMIVNAFILAGIYFLLPESKKPDPNFSLKPRPIIKSFTSIIVHPQFYTYALTASISAAGMYAYISGSPSVFMDLFHVSEKQYGWIFALIAMGLIGSSQINSVLLRTYTSEQIIRIALACQTFVGLVMVTLTLLGFSELFITIFLIFLFLCCQGFTFPNASALSLAPFGHNAGSASALLGGIQMSIGACTSALVSVFQNNTALPMTGVMACCATGALTVLLVGRKIICLKARQNAVEQEDVEMISTL
ncbi:Bcr/CflA family drug resistance efflux transporter [Niastella koreensis]|uniref:Drug resistance transporter, Bcr/CflA subfamily n=2 Tax=Niastella koreensis TaxID=354356 RepID=G8TDH2_NIAKG|nr:multidrug effflux MFS transporter [Niastella koreensis]AEW00422.1 drug resistance transporter, Bcr/CflA subfamily [Niastella koreensis GR20-10]OQP52288.1 Bcr/CflA family drug resistance efflux transporter [Niastella koreensis]